MATVEYAHVSFGADNVPMLAGTRIKVVEIVLDHLARGATAEDIQRGHPHLTLGQVYSALAYYYDHKAEIDADIARRTRVVDEIQSRLGDSPAAAKLRALKNQP